jgi:hypothetical protein
MKALENKHAETSWSDAIVYRAAPRFLSIKFIRTSRLCRELIDASIEPTEEFTFSRNILDRFIDHDHDRQSS